MSRAAAFQITCAHPSRSNRAKKRDAPRKQRLPLTERLELKGISKSLVSGEKTKGGENGNVVLSAALRRAKSKENAQMWVRYDSERGGMNNDNRDDEDCEKEIGAEERGKAKVVEILQRLKENEERFPRQLSDAWFRMRVGMVTASDVGGILGLEKRRDMTMEKIMEKKFKQRERYEEMMVDKNDDEDDGGNSNRIAIPIAMNKVPATKHGDYYENIAIKHYEKITGEVCHSFGLKTHDEEEYWFLGASPDGLTESGKIVEVKCPYTRKIQRQTRCLEHYSQIQTLLEVFDLEVCDFVQFKPAGKGTGHSGDVSRPKMLIECVKRDRLWFQNHSKELVMASKKLPMPLS
jgi:putative phage-type endonuclease